MQGMMLLMVSVALCVRHMRNDSLLHSKADIWSFFYTDLGTFTILLDISWIVQTNPQQLVEVLWSAQCNLKLWRAAAESSKDSVFHRAVVAAAMAHLLHDLHEHFQWRLSVSLGNRLKRRMSSVGRNSSDANIQSTCATTPRLQCSLYPAFHRRSAGDLPRHPDPFMNYSLTSAASDA
jgi:hypothetical protein